MKFVIDSAAGGQYYFKIVANNGETLCHSENYRNAADARHAVDLIKAGAADAKVENPAALTDLLRGTQNRSR